MIKEFSSLIFPFYWQEQTEGTLNGTQLDSIETFIMHISFHWGNLDSFTEVVTSIRQRSGET